MEGLYVCVCIHHNIFTLFLRWDTKSWWILLKYIYLVFSMFTSKSHLSCFTYLTCFVYIVYVSFFNDNLIGSRIQCIWLANWILSCILSVTVASVEACLHYILNNVGNAKYTGYFRIDKYLRYLYLIYLTIIYINIFSRIPGRQSNFVFQRSTCAHSVTLGKLRQHALWVTL